MNERIKKLRKALDLTQQEFAERIGVKRNTIATYEIGRNTPLDAVITLICREFNASETWLRMGEGEMFLPSPNGALDELAQKYGLSSRGKIIVERFLELKPDVQEAMADYIEKVASAFWDAGPSAPVSAPAFAPAHTPTIEEQARAETAKAAKPGEHPLTIDEQVELYRQQLLLEEEQAKQASSANESGAV